MAILGHCLPFVRSPKNGYFEECVLLTHITNIGLTSRVQSVILLAEYKM